MALQTDGLDPEVDNVRVRVLGTRGLMHTYSPDAKARAQKFLADVMPLLRHIEEQRRDLATYGSRISQLESSARTNVAEIIRHEIDRLDDLQQKHDHAIQWIGVVRDELVQAGYPGGDRDVALANLRSLIFKARDMENSIRFCSGSCSFPDIAKTGAKRIEELERAINSRDNGEVYRQADELTAALTIVMKARAVEAEWARCGWCGEARADHPTVKCGGPGLDQWTRPKWAEDADDGFINRMVALRDALTAPYVPLVEATTDTAPAAEGTVCYCSEVSEILDPTTAHHSSHPIPHIHEGAGFREVHRDAGT